MPDRELLVGGPLTVTPALRESLMGRAAIGVLGGVLRAWWALVRPLAG